MNVICLEDEAFYGLIDRVLERIKSQLGEKEDKWISAEEAKRKLRISSNSTLQILRDEGKIRFTQPHKKVILYDLDSINEHLEKHAKDTF